MLPSARRAATSACAIPPTRSVSPSPFPLHTEIAFGTLRRILRDARVTVEELVSIL